MNKQTPAVESLHHSAKSAEICSSGRFEIHRDVHIRHAQARDDASLVCKRIVRGRQRQIDDHIKTSLANCSKLLFGGLTCSAKLLTDGAEVVNLKQRGR